MSNSFHGNIEELKALFNNASIQGTWSDGGEGKHTFRTPKKGTVNWWESSGTIQIQGKVDVKSELENSVSSALSGGDESTCSIEAPAAITGKKQIFIVHGHDTEARDQLELALHRLELKPFILMNTSGEGKTIIEALEGQIGKGYSAGFGIVLMTPDDRGYAIANGEEEIKPRARQNVVLETGMLLSSLTRKRMAIIVKDYLEIPSD